MPSAVGVAAGWTTSSLVLCAVLLGSVKAEEVSEDINDVVGEVDVIQEPFWKRYVTEVVMVVVILLYGLMVILGKYRNDRIVKTWSATYLVPGGVYDRNFSLVGSGHPGMTDPVMRETLSTFRVWASGRRYCSGVLTTLDLKARQDCLSMLWYIVSTKVDTMEVEVWMSEAHMPLVSLAVAPTKHARSLFKDSSDLASYARTISVPKDRLPSWPSHLQVCTEHTSVFCDLFSDPKICSVLDSNPLFRYLHFSSDYLEGNHRHVLRFSFRIPPDQDMTQLEPLIALAFHFIDVVGSYKMPQELRKKAVEARTKKEVEATQDQSSRREALQKKKMEKMQAEKMKAARQGPEALQKWEDKQKERAMKKAMKSRRVVCG